VCSVTDTIASWEVGLVSSLGEMTGTFDLVGNAATKRMQADLDAAKVTNELNDKIRSLRMDSGYSERQERRATQQTFRELDDQVASNGSLGKSDEARQMEQISRASSGNTKAQAAAAAEYATQMKIARGDVIATGEDSAKAAGRAKEQAQSLLQIGRSQLSLVEQEARMRLDGADQYIGRFREGKGVAEETIRTLSEGLKSGKERFAAMSDEDQQSTLLAGEKARVDPLSLSDKERGLLRSVGTQQAQQAASFADVKEADSKGFNRVFGGEERQQIAAAQQQVQRVNLEVTNATQFKVDVQLRAQEVSQAISLDLKSIIAESNKQVVAMVQREVAASEQRIRAENAKTNIVRR